MKKLLLYISTLWILTGYANTAIDSLQQSLQAIDPTKHPKLWAEQAYEVGDYFAKQGNDSLGRLYFDSLLHFAHTYQITPYQYSAKLSLAKFAYKNGEFEKSLEQFEEVLNALPSTYQSLQGEALRGISGCHIYLANYSEAYAAQMKALALYEELNDAHGLAFVNYGIGNNFFYQEQYDIALPYFQKALALWKSEDDAKGMGLAVGAIGSVYEYMGNIDKAIEYNLQSLEYAKVSNNVTGIAWQYYNAGYLYVALGDYKSALFHFEQAKLINEQARNKPLEGYILEGQTKVYLELRQYKKVLLTLDQAYTIVQQNNDVSNMGRLLKTYATTYFEMKDYEQYRNYMETYTNLKDSLFSEQLVSELSELKQDFAVQSLEKEQEIELLKKDKEINNVKFWYGLGIIGASLVIMTLIAVLMYMKNKNERQMNDLLRKKNEEIMRQNDILVTSNKDLQQYAYIISHDLKEPLRSISGFATLLKRQLHKGNISTQKEYLDYITTGVDQINTLMNDLLEYSKINTFTPNEKRWVNTSEVVHQILQHKAPITKELQAKINVRQLTDVYFEPKRLHKIFHNIIDNALKFHSKDRPLIIEISHNKKAHFHQFIISDNGIGIDANYYDKVFTVFQRLHARGVYKGSGVGLATCKKIIEANGGQIWLDATPNQGTTVYFTIPIKKRTTVEKFPSPTVKALKSDII